MSTETLAGPRSSQQVAESQGWSAPGVPVLVAGVVLRLAGAGGLDAGPGPSPPGAGRDALVPIGVVLLLAAPLAFRGLTPVVAGQARVVQLFGRYRGTVRE